MKVGIWSRAGRVASPAFAVALIVITAGVGLLSPSALVSAAESASVSITTSGGILPGSNFTAAINISQVVNLDAATYDVSFDPLVLRLNSVTNGSINGKTVPVDAWNQREPGRYSVVQNVPGLTGVSGNGSLSVLQFSVIGSLSTSTGINLSNGVLGDTLAQRIPATWSGALIQAIPPAPSAPASFSISDFSISKREVGLGESVTISVLVTNTGGSQGTYPVILKVNGVQEAEEAVILGAGQIRTVTFLVAKSAAGAYAIDVNGKTGQFTVVVPPPVPQPASPPPASSDLPPATSTPTQSVPVAPPSNPPPTDAAPPAAQIIPVPGVTPTAPVSSGVAANGAQEQSPSAPQPPPPAPSSFLSSNWLLLGGVGGAVIVIGLVIFLAVRRRL